jgi:hypothetical protein
MGIPLVQYRRENHLVVKFRGKKPGCFRDVFCSSFGVRRTKGATKELRGKPKFHEPAIRIDQIFDVQQSTHADREASFLPHLAGCGFFIAFAALDPATGRHPKTILSGHHMPDHEEASFVLDDRSSGNAMTLQGVGHIWLLR